MPTNISDETATLLDAFCRAWMRDREVTEPPSDAVAASPDPATDAATRAWLFALDEIKPNTATVVVAPVKPRRSPLPRTITKRPSKVRAVDGKTAYEYRSNEYITIAQRRFPVVEIEANPVRIWLTEKEAKEVSAIASWRGQTAGRTKHRTIHTTIASKE